MKIIKAINDNLKSNKHQVKNWCWVFRFVDKFSSPQSGLENLYKSGKWLA